MIKSLAILSLLVFILLASTHSVLAIPGVVEGPELKPTDPLTGAPVDLYNLGAIIQLALRWSIFLAGIVAFIYLMIGGLRYLTAQGDPKATTQAQHTLTYAFLGLVIVFVAFFVIRILETVLGLQITSNLIPSAYAQVDIGNKFNLQPGQSINQVYGHGSPQGAKLGDLIGTLVPAIQTIAGLGFMVYLIIGAFRFTMSRGDQKAVDSAKKTISTAFTGLLIVFASYMIIQVLQVILGYQIL